MQTNLQQQRGITLLEVVITMAVLSFGAVAILKLQSYLISHSTVTKQQSEALLLSQQKVEELRDFEEVATSGGGNAYNDIVNGSQSVNAINTTYTLTWTVTEQTDPDHKVVDITTSWTDRNGQSHSMSLSSIINKMDPVASGALISGSSAGAIQPN